MDDKNVLENIINVLKNNFYLIEHDISFKSAYLIGSSLYFNSPRDLDIMLIYDDYSKYENDLQYFPHFESKCKQQFNFCIKRFDYLVDKNFDSVENLLDNFFIKVAETSTKVIPLFILDELYNIDLSKYNLITNIEYKNNVIKYIYNKFLIYNTYSFLKNELNNKRIPKGMNNSYFTKIHRLLATCYILYNNSYELTEEQKQILNQVHDSNEMPDELFEWCKNLITELYSNIGGSK